TPHYSDYPKDDPRHFLIPTDEPYSQEDWSPFEKNYAAMITRLDSDVGKILALIDSQKLSEETLIIFTSDNGPYQGKPEVLDFFDSNGPYRGGKRDLYEGGIKIPMIAKWTGNILPNSTCTKAIAFWDF